MSGNSGRDAATRGWGSWLAAAVVLGLLFEGASGAWMELAPAGRLGEILLLLHLVVGALLTVPFLRYLWRHVAAWLRQKATAEMVLGYLLGVASVALFVTGWVLAWQAWFGPRVGDAWHLVHLVLGLGAPALLVAHGFGAWLRRRPQARRDAELSGAQRGFARRVLAGSLGLVIVAGSLAFVLRSLPASFEVPADYVLPAHAQSFEEYRGSPFAPSFARTADLRLVDASVLAGSASCGSGGCHEQVYAEWQPSAHRFAAMNAPFQSIQKAFAADREPAETRYCAGCHDPISLFAGAKNIHNQSLSAPGMVEGVSCVACHAISQVDQRGNADYVLTVPHRYLWEHASGLRKRVSDFLIRGYPRRHLADYDRNLLRTPEFCGACHKQFIPEALNRFGMSEAQNQFDEWRRSHWHTDDPATDLACRDCHMRLVDGSTDPGRGEAGDRRRRADDGRHRHHGTIGTNFFIPQVLELPNWERHVALTKEWVQGETVLPELVGLWPEGPVASLDLQLPSSVERGEEAAVRAVVTNRKAGHNFVTGPLDFVRSWIHLRVTDATGEVVAEFGTVDPVTQAIEDRPGESHGAGNPRDEGTLVLEGMPIDESGARLLRHELWKKAGGEGTRVIFPRYSDSQLYRFAVPREAVGPLTVEAELLFRRYRQQFLDLAVPELTPARGVVQPILVQSRGRGAIALSSAGPADPPGTSASGG